MTRITDAESTVGTETDVGAEYNAGGERRAGRAKRAASAAVGGALLTVGVRRRSLVGAAMGLLGIVPETLADKLLYRFQSLAETGEIPTLERNPSARGAGNLV